MAKKHTDPNGVAADPNGVAADPNGVAADPNGVAADPNGVAADPNGVAADPFSTAFDEFASEPDPGVAPAAVIPPKTPETPEAAAAVDTGLPDPDTVGRQPVDPSAPAVADPAADTAAAAAAAAVVEPAQAEGDKPEGDEALLDRFRGIVKEGVKEGVKEVTAPATPEQPDIQPFTADEQALIEQYTKDYPNESRAEALIRRREYQEFAGFIFKEISKEIVGPMSNLTQQVHTLLSSTHEDAIHTAIPDYDEVAPRVIAWARDEKQPAYLRQAYEAVITRGTPADVVDLVDRWRAASGTATPAAAAPTRAQPAVASRAASATAAAEEAARKAAAATAAAAAAALAPVGSKRSGVSVQGMVDPGDFNTAFEEAAKLP